MDPPWSKSQSIIQTLPWFFTSPTTNSHLRITQHNRTLSIIYKSCVQTPPKDDRKKQINPSSINSCMDRNLPTANLSLKKFSIFS